MQKKVVFFGTYLHKPLNESFSKQVHTIINALKNKIDYFVISLENEKKPIKEKNYIIIRKIKMRFFYQSLSLPMILIFLRIKGYNNFHFLQVPSRKFYKLLFKLLNLLNSNTIITLTKNEKRYLKNCDNCKIIINNFNENYKSKKLFFILPPTKIPKLNNKELKRDNIAISTTPFKVKYLEDRGILTLIKIFKKIKEFKLILLCRGEEVKNYLKKFVKSSKINNIQVLGNVKIKDYFKKSKIIFNLYKKNSPEIPLSGMEGLSYGCYLISYNNLLGRLAQKLKIGKVIKKDREIISELKKLSKNKKINTIVYNHFKKFYNFKENIDKIYSLYK